jgi:enoyl-CoA hydratase
MSSFEFYLVEKKPPVAWVYLNRPEKKNAMNWPAWTEAPKVFQELDQDPDIRVIVLSGKGSCFSTGLDLPSMMSEMPEITGRNQRGPVKWKLIQKIQLMQETMSCIQRCKKPVIAAIHSYCIGGGLDMATACDIRICSQDAVFCVKETALAMVADVGVLQRLPFIVGQGIAREMALTAKNIPAQRAKEIMLVNEIYPNQEILLAEAEKLALIIAENSPIAVQATKDVLNYGIGHQIADGLKYVAAMNSNIIPSEDLMEAAAAFMEKRKPQFTGK